MIGGLVENETDVGLTYFFVTEARSRDVKFSPAITEGILRWDSTTDYCFSNK